MAWPSWATASANLGFFFDKTLDALLDGAASEPDFAKRKGLYDQAQQIINTEAPMVLLYTAKDLIGVKKTVSGVWAIPGGEVEAAYAKKS